ncbi:hypothetical protein MUP95_06050 [bacterium]|nr:hypothetical protein [bacterium]
MNLILFSFDLEQEDQHKFIETVEELQDYWQERGFVVSLFWDTNRKNRFLQTLLTEKTVNELTDLIQNDPYIKAMFSRLKDSETHLVVSCMEQIL